ncbi:hypothetical protein [Priestia koreensis]|uniref:hypothetical protein n=1 Tax=Priestia koreensis TaxID=284581 RepID=UPI001F5A030F|nr:hypothetical protein [Priestia koreensis]MCM3005003.1 hypothetical protein [Priestia koreensis]UNL82996.1 hypothetical protein IE339_12385 [Priestia koreensis]
MRNFFYLLGGTVYLVGLLFLLHLVGTAQLYFFNDNYQSLLFPFFALFIVGLYVSLSKLLKRMKHPGSRLSLERPLLKLGICILSMLAVLVVLYVQMSHAFILIVTVIGYITAVVTGFTMMKLTKKSATN